MTHNALADMLKRAGLLVATTPVPEAEVSEKASKKVEKAVKGAVAEVAIAANAADTATEKAPKGDDTEVMPPSVFVPTPPPAAKVEDKPKDKFAPKDPTAEASYRSKRFLSFIGMVRPEPGSSLVSIRMLAKPDTPERDRIDADWDAGSVHDAIQACLADQQYTHEDGWKVYPNRQKVAQHHARVAEKARAS